MSPLCVSLAGLGLKEDGTVAASSAGMVGQEKAREVRLAPAQAALAADGRLTTLCVVGCGDCGGPHQAEEDGR
jgi:DNA helicase TIP49 (TBP-interacting protein)